MVILIHDNTENRDLFYAIKEEISDPFFFLDTGDKRYAFLDRREAGLLKDREDVEVVPLEPLAKGLPGHGRIGHLASKIIETYGASKKVEVNSRFPLRLADHLREAGVEVTPKDLLYPEREIKLDSEVDEIRSAVKRTEKAFEYLEEVFRDCSIDGGKLIYNGEILTSEFLKREVEKMFIDVGLNGQNGIIISSGEASAIPHHRGSGPVLANSPIVCDLFPRDIGSGYVADITRTFIKGKASGMMHEAYEAVMEAQEAVMSAALPGVRCDELHGKAVEVFERKGLQNAFIHATGHGIGLDLHEGPVISLRSRTSLVPGSMVTIEPGLYFAGVGGIRIEDDVLITEDGRENMSTFKKHCVIP